MVINALGLESRNKAVAISDPVRPAPLELRYLDAVLVFQH